MSPRRSAALVVWTLLLLVLLRRDVADDLVARATLLFRSAPLELSVRRLNGTAAAFDREFFIFLESVRRRVPPGVPGIVILGLPPKGSAKYLAIYHLTPVPVLVSPPRLPAGWVVAVYGKERPPGWRVISTVWKGALFAPPS